MMDWSFVQIIMQWGKMEEPEHTREDLRLRGVTVSTSLENGKNKNFMFIILCYNLDLKFLH
jgi:F0F1-type ATP synthase beta subunit